MATVSESSPIKRGRGHHPNSRRNLIRGYHGQDNSGNGGYSLTVALKAALRKSPEICQQIVNSTIEGAILREPTPFREVWDRVDGPLKDTPPVTVDNRQIIIQVNSERAKELLERIGERTGKLITGEE